MYPVTTPYGQVPGYPLNNGFHTGIDYGYPMGTPVVVNGVTIGLSNNTGASTGPHLHVGKYVGGAVQDPGVGNGFKFNSAVVYDTGSDATNGNYVRITGDGALWNYLHLEKVLVSKGQVLEGGNVATLTDLSMSRIFAYHIGGWGIVPGTLNAITGEADAQLQEHIGRPADIEVSSWYGSPDHQKLQNYLASIGKDAQVLKPGTYKVN